MTWVMDTKNSLKQKDAHKKMAKTIML
jgi:hypothetical protein